MSTARIPDGTPLGLVQVGLPTRAQSTPGRSDNPVKPRFAVVAAIRSGVQPMPETERERAKRTKTMPWKWYTCARCGRQCSRKGYGRDGQTPCPLGGRHKPLRQTPGPNGAAVECSTERSRAPEIQPVAPVEGRAWETPAMRTV